MNKAKFHLSLICLIGIVTMAQGQSKLQDVSFLIGTWKVENKESYEFWEMAKKNSMNGFGYKIKGGEKVVSENLNIKVVNNQIVYEAAVLNQNDGKTIPFRLNMDNKVWFSFENETHDSPQKIQYKILSKDTLQVQVLGDNDEGFSYKLIKQEQ
jgi:hypothetical protein